MIVALHPLLAAVLALARPASAAPLEDEVRLTSSERMGTAENPFDPLVLFSIRRGDADSFITRALSSEELASFRKWQVQILSDGRKAAYVQGDRPPEAQIPWDGAGPDGRALNEGFYQARLVWQDAAGAMHRTPEISVAVFFAPAWGALAEAGLQLSHTPEGVLVRVAEALAFGPGSAALLPGANAALDQAAHFLAEYPGYPVAVRGYTDSLGRPSANVELSRRRAEVVCEYLQGQGIDAGRLSCEGRGAREPIASNTTPLGRGQNRRVEILLLRPPVLRGF